ncbi:hypothetical protein [Leifsonia aquatica]|uniref:hypothetical protein n=1 Tax=Leifsonia aquatica TaxID=144185 RepID=UPI0013B3C16C|nr:hypothetical protein [Leifsonia aquatica]
MGKYKTSEHGEARLSFRGVGAGSVSVAPESWVLSVRVEEKIHEIVVNRALFDAYEIGDPYPGGNSTG